MRPIIHSKKHILQMSQFTIAQAAVDTQVVVLAQEAVSTTPSAVEVGAVVKAVYIEYWLGNASATVVGSYTTIVMKNPGGNAVASATTLAALHDYDNKKNILFTSQALVPPTDGGQVQVIKHWIKIPKGKQRFGLGDRIDVVTRNNNSTAVDINGCGFALFKEYS